MLEHIKKLCEITLSGISKKQKDITNLFPTFHDRVKAVGEKGGVRLMSLTAHEWNFRVHSGTENNKWYAVEFYIKDMSALLQKYVPNKDLWTKDGQKVDLRKVARAIFFDADVEVNCSCLAQQYWGPAYQLTKADAKYGRKEYRAPKKRNPHEFGIACKHVQALLNVLPFYITTIAKWLKEKYRDEIKELQDNTLKQEAPEPEEPEEVEDTQQDVEQETEKEGEP